MDSLGRIFFFGDLSWVFSSVFNVLGAGTRARGSIIRFFKVGVLSFVIFARGCSGTFVIAR